MKRQLEIIHLRLVEPCPKSLMAAIKGSAVAKRDDIEMKIYQQSGVATDVGIHLHHAVIEDDSLPCDLGILLASALREHGMVEHTLWIEEKQESL